MAVELDYEKIQRDFVAESSTLLENVEAAVLRLEKQFIAADLDEIFRSIHTIKGNSAIFKNRAVSKLAHETESALSILRNQQTAPPEGGIDTLLIIVDVLRNLINNMDEQVVGDTEIADLVSRLQGWDGTTQDESEPQPAAEQNRAIKKIKVPEKFIKLAKDSNRNLHALVLDLVEQPHASALEFIEFLEETGSKYSLTFVHQGPIPSRGNKPSTKLSLPYIVLFLSDPGLNIDSVLQGFKVNHLQAIVTTEVAATLPVKRESALPTTDITINDGFLKVSFELLDQLVNVTGEAVIAKNEFQQYLESIKDSRLSLLGKKLSGLILGLQDIVLKTRLQPLQAIYDRLPRIVRDTATQTQKKVELTMEGGEVELDKNLLDSIVDPFTHIVRNAIDHGLELPAERLNLGKKESGKILISAELSAGKVQVQISDDGRGFSLAKIKQIAIDKSIVTADAAAALNENEILELVFLPGFSTASKVTTTSGRGVGMDVVRKNLRRIGGAVELRSDKGRGSTVHLTLPQTMSIIAGLLISTSNRRYAIPQKYIKEVIRLDKNSESNFVEDNVYRLRGDLLSLVNLSRVLSPESNPEKMPYIVVVRTEGNEFGIMVEEIINTEEIVVKPLGSLLDDINLFSGVAILGDGDSIMILDCAGLASFVKLQPMIDKHKNSDKDDSLAATKRPLFLFKVGVQYCAVDIADKPRVLHVRGQKVVQYMNMPVLKHSDRIVSIVSLQDMFHIQPNGANDQFLLLFSVDGYEVAFPVRDIINVIDSYPDIDHSAVNKSFVEGQFLLDGDVVMILEPGKLIKNLYENEFAGINTTGDLESITQVTPEAGNNN